MPSPALARQGMTIVDPMADRAQDNSRLQLRILATSDLHAQILPWDELTDQAAPDRGLAQVASLVALARAEVANTVLLDNGDFLNGSPLADYVAEHHGRRSAHPIIAAMNALGYDAATLGNHEFSNGLALLRRALRQARFPVVATNLDRVSPFGRRPFLPRQILLHRDMTDQNGKVHRLAIGILGFLPPQTALWERRHMTGKLATRGILEAARQAVPRLRRAGADLVVALSHSGLGLEQDDHLAENISCALAALDGIDAVIAGHTHQVHPLPDTPPQKYPMVMPGFFGSHLGVIDLTLGQGNGRWQVLGHQTHVRPVAMRDSQSGKVTALVPADPTIAAHAAADLKAMHQRAAHPVGQSKVDLTSYFALIGHSAVQTLLATAQSENMARALTGHAAARLPMLVAVAPFKAGGRGGPTNFTAIPAGALTGRNMADLYIHPNSPVAMQVTGAELRHWLERSVSLFRQIVPGRVDQMLVDTDFPAYNFDMVHGLTYQIDLSQPARYDCTGKIVAPDAQRIVDIRFQGRPLQPDQPFVLVTNSYRAAGGAGFAGTPPSRVVMEESRPLRLVLQEHVTRSGQIAPQAHAEWRFKPMPGTSVLFDSAPAAAPHAAAVPGLEPIGLQPTGFLRFRLRL